MQIMINKLGSEATNGELAIGQIVEAFPVKSDSLYALHEGVEVPFLADGFGGILVSGEYEVIE